MKRKPPRKPKPFEGCRESNYDIQYCVVPVKPGTWSIGIDFASCDTKEAKRLSRWLVKAAEYVEYKNRG